VCEDAISAVKRVQLYPTAGFMLVYGTKQSAVKYFRKNSVIISRGEFRGFYGFYGRTAVSLCKSL
jgi:hypothetical protein